MTAANDGAALEDFIRELLSQGIEQRASDIHIEPMESAGYRIRMRIDGVLRIRATCPPTLASRLLVCLKMMARLDIAERRHPQDGQFVFGPPERQYSFRLSTLPTLRGEKIVLRLLCGRPEEFTLERLGMPSADQEVFIRQLLQPQGLVVLTGPTGSGKTMTLYAALSVLRRGQLNICSVEDPVEIPLPDITQCQVNAKAQLDFAELLRALLRQDPDVIMVGEIRDRATAAIALHAAQTGRLVLSTLHTRSAADTLRRFQQLGVGADQASAVLLLVVAQRLVRRLCAQCRLETIGPSISAARLPAGLTLQRRWYAAGCRHCHDGYSGRCGLFHLARTGTANGRRADEQGLWQAGLALAEQGTTSVEELARVLGDPL